MVRGWNCLVAIWILLAGIACAQSPDETKFENGSESGRHGFIVGFSIGPGLSLVSQNARPGPFGAGSRQFEATTSEIAVNSDFKIGFAVDKQSLVFFNTKVAWFREEILVLTLDSSSGSFQTTSNNEMFAGALSGVGLCYYTKPTLPCWFVSGTMGFASFGTPFKDNSVAESGFGAGLEIGYEFAPHWIVKGCATYCHTSDDPVSTNVFTLGAQVGFLSF